MKSLWSVLAFWAVTAVLFGSPFQATALATIWSDRLGIPHWRFIAVICVAVSALILVPPLRSRINSAVRLPVFAILAVLLPTIGVGLYADSFRRDAASSFGADEIDGHTIFESIRHAPANFQFYLHTAALKDCVPYAWSYRTLSFYELPPSVAINVLPQTWVLKCGMAWRKRKPLDRP